MTSKNTSVDTFTTPTWPSFSQIIDDGFKVFAKHWWFYALVGLVITIPAILISLIPSLQTGVGYILALGVSVLLSMIASIVFVASSRQYLENRWVRKDICKTVSKTFWKVLLTWISLLIAYIAVAFAILLIFGLLFGLIYLLFKQSITSTVAIEQSFTLIAGIVIAVAFVISFIIAMILWMFATYIPVISKIYGFSALQSSFRLVFGRWWGLFARYIGFQLIALMLIISAAILSYIILLPLSGSVLVVGVQIQTVLFQLAVIPSALMIIMLFLRTLQKESITPWPPTIMGHISKADERKFIQKEFVKPSNVPLKNSSKSSVNKSVKNVVKKSSAKKAVKKSSTKKLTKTAVKKANKTSSTKKTSKNTINKSTKKTAKKAPSKKVSKKSSVKKSKR